VTSRETILDVMVTDKDGSPVHGLTQADFSIEQDGKPQTIRSFHEASKAEERALPKLAPGVYSNLGATPESGPVNVILLDLLNNKTTSMVYAKKATIEYLKTMPPGTEVAVFELSANRGLRMVQGFTSDGAAAAESVAEVNVDWITTTPSYLIKYDWMSYEAMHQIAAYVSGIKGRKNLILFSVGMPIGLQLNHDRTFNVKYEEMGDLVDRLIAEQIAISFVDPSGVPSLSPHPGTEEAFGGLSYFNSNDLKSLVAKAVDDGRSYYTLSYVPPDFATDDRRHSIEVKVDRPGLNLVYRKGFRADEVAASAPALGPKLMQASMERGLPPATQILFDVKVQPSTEAKRPTDPAVMGILDTKLKKTALMRYGFLYTVPADQITFANEPDGAHHGWLEFDVVAFNADGQQVTMLSQNMQMPLTGDEYGEFVKTPLNFFQQIDLPPGALTLRVGILDRVSNKVGTVEIPLTVAKGSVVAGR
jgi:VWFA-related protein